MLNFLILDNKKDYYKILLDIDTKIYQISKRALYNAKYGLRDKVDYNLVEKLGIYKSILITKLFDSNSLCRFRIEDIVARIKRLINDDGYINYNNSLTGCTPDNCTINLLVL